MRALEGRDLLQGRKSGAEARGKLIPRRQFRRPPIRVGRPVGGCLICSLRGPATDVTGGLVTTGRRQRRIYFESLKFTQHFVIQIGPLLSLSLSLALSLSLSSFSSVRPAKATFARRARYQPLHFRPARYDKKGALRRPCCKSRAKINKFSRQPDLETQTGPQAPDRDWDRPKTRRDPLRPIKIYCFLAPGRPLGANIPPPVGSADSADFRLENTDPIRARARSGGRQANLWGRRKRKPVNNVRGGSEHNKIA